ncbi:MAG: ComEC/Rec2 family competence protein [Spirochaetes bacterium]|nr:ComEC/Rec2 family competence protein [Spirochaetota bacterium]
MTAFHIKIFNKSKFLFLKLRLLKKKTKNILNFILFLIFFLFLSFIILLLDTSKDKFIKITHFLFEKNKTYLIKITTPSSGIFNQPEYKGIIIGEGSKNNFKKYNYRVQIKIFANSSNLLDKNYYLIIKFPENKIIKINQNTNFGYIYLSDLIIINIYKIENFKIFSYYNLNTKSTYSKFRNFILKKAKFILKKINLSFFFASITGSKIFLNKNLYNNYTLTGTSHILALSGLHLGIVISFIILLCIIFNLTRSKIIIFSLIVSFIYLILTDFIYYSLIRAYLMFFLISFIYLKNKNLNPLKFLPFLFFLSFLFIKKEAFSLSFILSITSIYAIFILYPLIEDSLIKTKNILLILLQKNKNEENKLNIYIENFINKILSFLKPFILSITILFFQSPLILYYFNRMNVFSWLINPIIILLFTINFYLTTILIIISIFNIYIFPINSLLNSLFYIQHLIVSRFRFIFENINLNNKEFNKINLILIFVLLLLISYIIKSITTIKNEKKNTIKKTIFLNKK